ncbi:MAG: hypothetical protein GY807_11030 [Gammaproteobacteria bacterium]|nr:hypothetical protein [Gammaproteobacteria bacterium]
MRAVDACQRIRGAGGNGRRDLVILHFDDGLPESDERAQMTAANETLFAELFSDGDITRRPIKLGVSGQRSATSRSTGAAIGTAELFSKYDDVVVDISAMPRMIAMSTIAKLIRLLDDLETNESKRVNLHVTTAESPEADRNHSGGSLSDTVTTVVGFSGRLNSEVSEHIPRVWFPILGEGQEARLTLIREELRPDEICPVIPFPSREPRRGDEIVASYRQILFDSFQVEPRNILYACEFNPFEAYKQIFLAIDRYRDALSGLGGCKAFVSPLSSKLLSVGALLACYDHAMSAGSSDTLAVGIPYVETSTYGSPNQTESEEREVYSMWIRGEWEH